MHGDGARDVAYRYLAVISGDCEQLVVSNDELTSGCLDKLVNVDFGDGRVMFVFTRPGDDGMVMTAFSGHASQQADLRSYRLRVDEVRTTTTDAAGRPATIAMAVEGGCAMTGDPLTERALFTCSVESGAHRTLAVFRSADAPAVYAGARTDVRDPLALAVDPPS